MEGTWTPRGVLMAQRLHRPHVSLISDVHKWIQQICVSQSIYVWITKQFKVKQLGLHNFSPVVFFF